jgi:hypothetical protein
MLDPRQDRALEDLARSIAHSSNRKDSVRGQRQASGRRTQNPGINPVHHAANVADRDARAASARVASL